MSKIAVVTGANQGLGFALAAGLCRTLPAGSIVYLAARDVQRGEDAARILCDQGLEPVPVTLDVADDASVQSLAEVLTRRHGGVDIVISNAAARMTKEVPQAAQVRNLINTNNHGTYRMIRELGPLLRDGGRFLTVASRLGSLTRLDSRLHHHFDITKHSLADIERVMDDYVALVEHGQDVAQHWPEWINIPSKIGQVAATKIYARQRQEEALRRGILINAVCPGLIDTPASRPWFADMSAARSPEDAATDVIWLATLPTSAPRPYGELVQYRQLIPWT